MVYPKTFILALSFSFFQPALADVQVTTSDNESGESVIKINKEWAKVVDLTSPGQHMLINMTNSAVYVIDNENQLVVRLEEMQNTNIDILPGQKDSKNPQIEIVKIGKGPTVAGYMTIKYQLKAEGNICSEHLISKGPLVHAEIKSFSEQMKKQSEFDDGTGYGSSACELAERRFDKKSMDYGVPLVSRDANGVEFFRITDIKTNITFPKGEFSFPKGYQKVSQKELMQQQLEEAMSNRKGGMMEMESGKMPSEAEMKAMQEQLMQLQEMMNNREDR